MLCSSCIHYEVAFNTSHCNHPENLYKQKRKYRPGQIKDYFIREKETPEDKNRDGCCKDFEENIRRSK